MNTRHELARQAFDVGQAVGLGFTQPLDLMGRGAVGRILAVKGEPANSTGCCCTRRRGRDLPAADSDFVPVSSCCSKISAT